MGTKAPKFNTARLTLPGNRHGTAADSDADLRLDLANEKRKFQAMFDDSPIGIALMRGPQFIFEKVNEKFTKLVSPREYIGKRWTDVYVELPDSPLPALLGAVYDTGQPYTVSGMLLRVEVAPGVLDDQYYDFTYNRLLGNDGRPYGVFCQCANVTRRLHIAMELERAKEDAERARRDAENANQTKSAFLANVSHEIRTPLGAILGFTELLRDPQLSASEKSDFLETISRNGKALTRIIDDVLDLAKIEAGKLEVEESEFSLHELVDDVMALFREKTLSKRLALTTHIAADVPDRIATDPTRLRQILINIVGNAVKFSDAGSVALAVTARAAANQRFDFSVVVKDTGIGLSDEQQARLFQPFSQADNTTARRFGGSGLGLALSRRLANALGGSIDIGPCALGAGSTFLVTFSAAVPHAAMLTCAARRAAAAILGDATRDASAGAAPRLTGIEILLADDSLDNQALFKRMLARSGAQVDVASNGLEAYHMGVKGSYDLVLMDIQMPGMDGYEATQALRAAGFRRPIIALTAHAMAEERARTRAAGCDAHLTKPLERQQLLAMIEAFVLGPESSKAELLQPEVRR